MSEAMTRMAASGFRGRGRGWMTQLEELEGTSMLDLPLSFFNTSTYLCTVYSILTDSLSYMTSRAYVQHGRNRAMKFRSSARAVVRECYRLCTEIP